MKRKENSLRNRRLFNLGSTGSSLADQADESTRNKNRTDGNPELDRRATQELSQELNSLEQKSREERGRLHQLFEKKEFITSWIREFAIRPTPFEMIFGMTLYCVAVASALKKREGDGWLRTALHVKLPGYSTLYQNSSWQTLKNSLLTKPLNPYSGLSQDQLLQNALNKGMPDLAGRGRASTPDILEFVDLRKDKAYIYVRPPWSKRIRQDFVGVFSDQEFLQKQDRPSQAENDLSKPSMERYPILPPWYRIEALRKPSQLVLATPDQTGQDRSSTAASFSQNELHRQRERSLLYLRTNRTQISASSTRDTIGGSGAIKASTLSADSLSDKISGFEYFLPFPVSRERVFAENDRIPFKLESPYSKHSSSRLLEDRSKAFVGKQLYLLQHNLRELFYLYGFSPPNHLSTLADSKLSRPRSKQQSASTISQSLGDEQTDQRDQKDAKIDNLKESSQPQRAGRLNKREKEELSQSSQEFERSGFSHGAHENRAQELLSNSQPSTQLDSNQLVKALSSPRVDSKKSNLTDAQDVQGKRYNDQSKIGVHYKASGSRRAQAADSKATPFLFKSWPLTANANSFAPENGSPLNNFEINHIVPPRLMSGYKLPDYTQQEVGGLFQGWVSRRLFVSLSVNFPHSYLIDQVLLRPLYVQFPPFVPFSFFENLALSLSQFAQNKIAAANARNLPVWRDTIRTRGQAVESAPGMQATQTQEMPPALDAQQVSQRESAPFLTQAPKYSDIALEYRPTSLKELKEIKDAFVRLGRDYDTYMSLPKDGPLAIQMAPSLEDDRIIESEDKSSERVEDQSNTEWESLQELRAEEKAYEDGKEFRPFAYQNRYAYQQKDPVAIPSFQKSQDLPPDVDKTDPNSFEPSLKEQENSWVHKRLGSQNMLSDRKYSFFGRKHLLTKRLVAQEEKEINDQLLKSSYCTPRKLPLSEGEEALAREDTSLEKDCSQQYSLAQQNAPRCTPLEKLEERAQRRLIKLLGEPTFKARDPMGAHNRTRRLDRSARAKVIRSEWDHLRWQKKRFRSRVLTTPSNRHLVLPEISLSDWRKMLDWQLKNYFFLEERRLQKLKRKNPGEHFKVRRVQIYLPWVTVRTPSNQPFQWPLTRLDYADQIFPTQLHDSFCRLPTYTPVHYWDAGSSASMSLPHSDLTSHDRESDGSVSYQENETFLFEPVHDQSWLLVYRLFLGFALINLCKYIYRVAVKRFLIQIMRSELGLMTTSPQFREWIEHGPPKPFYTFDKRLRDVAAAQDEIPTLTEIVWYLRNHGRGRSNCRGLLLVGPAGTEKISVLQGLAGECRRPVIVQSLSALLFTDQDPYEQLERSFTLARKHAPCILFLDDLDVVGKSRGHVVTSNLGAADSLFALDVCSAEGRLAFANCSQSLRTTLLPQPDRADGRRLLSWELNPFVSNPMYQPDLDFSEQEQEAGGGAPRNRSGPAVAACQDSEQFKRRRLNLMLRLLTEMDGSMSFNGVVVVATSERPAMLDPALLRAGRFDRRVHLSLPSKERRIQLLKSGTQKLGHIESMPWDYLGIRTANMGVADISSAINHSAIRAIIDNTLHTVETVEHGLNCVAGVPNTPLSISDKKRSDPFHYTRLAYYQAGRAVVHSLLPDHPELGFCSLNDSVLRRSEIGSPYELGRDSLQVHISDAMGSPPDNQSLAERLEKSQFGFRKARAKRSENKDSQESSSQDQDSLSQAEVEETVPSQGGRSSSPVQSRTSSYTYREKSGPTFYARTREQFETRLVGLYAGKAAELLYLSCVECSDLLNGGGGGKQDLHSLAMRVADQVYKTDQSGEKRSVSRYSGWLWQSDLGFSELLQAGSLIHLMVDRYHLYSERVFTYKINRVIPSLNQEQMRDQNLYPVVKRFSKQLKFDHIKSPFWGITPYTNPSGVPIKQGGQDGQGGGVNRNARIDQERGETDWWQAKVCRALQRTDRAYGKWYRIYLPKANEDKWNEEWVPPDRIFHQSLKLANLGGKSQVKDGDANEKKPAPTRSEQVELKKRSQKPAKGGRRFRSVNLNLKSKVVQIQEFPQFKSLNDLYLFQRDRAYHNAVMSSFYTAFNLLNDNRELLDLFADHLIRYQILRSHEITKICSLFFSSFREGAHLSTPSAGVEKRSE